MHKQRPPINRRSSMGRMICQCPGSGGVRATSTVLYLCFVLALIVKEAAPRGKARRIDATDLNARVEPAT